MWADVDTKLDFLNYSEVAEIVAEVVRDPGMRPVTVGVFGTWGTGKSTLLNLVESRLSNVADSESDYIVVRFDAWLYQGFDDSRAALMEVIATTLLEKAGNNVSLIAKGKSLLRRVNAIRALGLLLEGGALAMGVPTFGFATKAVSALGDVMSGSADEEDISAIKEAGEETKKRGNRLLAPEEKRTPPKEIAAFREEFAQILTDLGKTLVVFVDNLDRCLPTQTIQTLEALRLFLFMEQTAFVVAADEDMVRHSVSKHFRDPGDRHVTDYLDKLIQVPVRVPRLGTQEVRAYLFLLFASAAAMPEARVELLRSGLETNLRRAWKEEPISTEDALGLLGNDVPEDVKLSFGIADRMAHMLANSVVIQGNPRIVKRMLNVVRMRSRVAKLREMQIDEALIAKLVLFERCTDDKAISHLYNEINAASDGVPKILTILENCRDDPEKFKSECPEAWAGRLEFLREWLMLTPPLAQMDLRPLVYLSRETTTLRAQRGGMSTVALEALEILGRTMNTSSPSATAALSSIPPGEERAVMAALIQSFRNIADWASKPVGFDGALLLAERSSEAGKLLYGFISTKMPGRLKPWLKVLVRNKPWFTSEGAQ